MKNAVYKNAYIVTGLSVAERCLGFLYRIVLSRLIGAEGLGLYQVALSIFALVSTLTTGGIPITVSRLVAKHGASGDKKKEHGTLSAGLFLSLCLALPLGLVLGLFSGKMPLLFSDMRAAEVFQILLFGLCFSCVYAVVRGYFWGKKQFFVASLLEMTEEITMVIAGVLLLRGVDSPVAGAKMGAWALAIGDILSCLIAVVAFFSLGGRLSKPHGQLKPLYCSAMPVTAVRASGSLVNSAVAVLLPAMLIRAGFARGEAMELFGVVTGMVLPVLFIPATLIGSLSLVLVPELSADYHQKRRERLQKNIERGLRFSFLVACALLPFFFVLGEDLGRLAFASPTAGKIIARSCLILLPMSLTIISSSMLNSIGFERQTFLFFFCGAAALLLSVLLLPPLCGVYAYVVGLGLSYAVTATCNLVFLRKKCPIFEKRGGQVCVQLLFPALFGILPLSILGQLVLALCKRFLGQLLSLLVTAPILAVACLCYALATRLLPLPKRARKPRKTKAVSAFF